MYSQIIIFKVFTLGFCCIPQTGIVCNAFLPNLTFIILDIDEFIVDPNLYNIHFHNPPSYSVSLK